MEDIIQIVNIMAGIGAVIGASFATYVASRNKAKTEENGEKQKSDKVTLEAEIKELKDKHDKVEEALGKQVTSLKDELAAERLGRKQDKDDMLRRHTELTNQVNDLTARVEKLSIENADLHKQNAQQRKELEEAITARIKAEAAQDAMLKVFSAMQVTTPQPEKHILIESKPEEPAA